ncbi:MAG: hydroxyacid dehydrogenase [Clostridia bacterium]|nr:hydroxyacid dehydrogenase [Clostridia bacterium]
MKAIFLCEKPKDVRRVFGAEFYGLTRGKVALSETVFRKEDVLRDPTFFSDVEVIFSTWGMPCFSEEEIALCFPRLRCVFYAAGTVRAFARPFLRSGVRVFSAWAANGIPVAEYTVSQILLANKGFFTEMQLMSAGNPDAARKRRNASCGNYGASVGIIGCGMIGSLVAEMLKRYELRVMAFDPFLSDARAEMLGVTKCTLEALFSECQVVSNHLANNAETVGMLRYAHFASMPDYATFLNTGRGAQVVEADLIRALSERPDLTAVLDVTYPEPPEEGSPFYALPNCFLTPHVAGSIGDEVRRMGKYAAEEFLRFSAGERCPYEVSEEMLAIMA